MTRIHERGDLVRVKILTNLSLPGDDNIAELILTPGILWGVPGIAMKRRSLMEEKTSPIEPRKKRAFSGLEGLLLGLGGLFALLWLVDLDLSTVFREIQKRNGLGDFTGNRRNWKFTGFHWWSTAPNQTPSPARGRGATPRDGVAPQKTA
jgi:hypothetical protein